jgi:DNA-binding phage protein
MGIIKTNPVRFASELRAAQERLGLPNVEAMAVQAGVGKTTMYRWMSGECIPRKETLGRVRLNLGISTHKVTDYPSVSLDYVLESPDFTSILRVYRTSWKAHGPKVANECLLHSAVRLWSMLREELGCIEGMPFIPGGVDMRPQSPAPGTAPTPWNDVAAVTFGFIGHRYSYTVEVSHAFFSGIPSIGYHMRRYHTPDDNTGMASGVLGEEGYRDVVKTMWDCLGVKYVNRKLAVRTIGGA